MPIAFDAASRIASSNAPTHTFSHTVTGSDRVLLVGAYRYGSVDDPVTGVTYAGVSMARLGYINQANPGYKVYIYGLAAPTTGANDIVITATGAGELGGAGASYTGVSQTGLPDASNTASAGSGTSLAIANTSVADNCWTVMFALNQWANFSAGASTTLRTSGANLAFFDSNAAKTPAGSVTLTGTWGGSAANAGVIVSIAPFVASARSRLLLLGVS